MKRLILIFIFLVVCRILPAPGYSTLCIIQPQEINEYERLINAVTWVESRHGRYVYNADENAVGWFQIREIRVKHYNKLRGTNYVLEDFYDYELSREMFLYFAVGKSYEKAARNWNGRWKLTSGYWKKVRDNL